MNNVLIYCRATSKERTAERTAEILSEELQQIGYHTENCHKLNIARLLLNPYQTVHFVVEDLPLNLNEVLFLAVAKALNKSTLVSVLNSEKKISKGFFEFLKPDAFSVSQTNHLKNFRFLSSNKFIFSPLYKTEGTAKKNAFQHAAFLIPLHQKMDEALNIKLQGTLYFDGRKLLKKSSSSQLRKKWNDLISEKKLSSDSHLILSDSKASQLIKEGGLSVVLADPTLQTCELAQWLQLTMNKNNLIILNEYQATGFSNYWTSGHNCYVLSAQKWMQEVSYIEKDKNITCSNAKTAELSEATINDLSRLYSKLWHQKTSLLTSRSVKL